MARRSTEEYIIKLLYYYKFLKFFNYRLIYKLYIITVITNLPAMSSIEHNNTVIELCKSYILYLLNKHTLKIGICCLESSFLALA